MSGSVCASDFLSILGGILDLTDKAFVIRTVFTPKPHKEKRKKKKQFRLLIYCMIVQHVKK